ncbi:hypothetical protein GCM10027614_30400 [Micromonospora vulcania]
MLCHTSLTQIVTSSVVETLTTYRSQPASRRPSTPLSRMATTSSRWPGVVFIEPMYPYGTATPSPRALLGPPKAPVDDRSEPRGTPTAFDARRAAAEPMLTV